MFNQQKPDVEKRLSYLSDELYDIKNQKKLAELDFEKRVVILEDSVNTINKTVGSAKNLKEMKENLNHILDIQSKIREVEDREIIDRLESIQTKDTLGLLEDDVSTMSEKLNLLSDAVQTIGKKTNGQGIAQKENLAQNIGASSKDLDLLRADIQSVRMGKADAESFEVLNSKYEDLKKAFLGIDKNFADLASSARNTLKKRDNDLAMVQKKIEDLETIQVKTSLLSTQVDTLRDADKKLETIVYSLRNQIYITEDKLKPLNASHELGKKAFNEIGIAKKELRDAKNGFEESLKKQRNELSNSIGAAEDSLKRERIEIQNTCSNIQKDYSKISKNVEDLNITLEKRVAKSTTDALEKQTRLQNESIDALKNTTRSVEKRSNEIEQVMQKRNTEYEKLCSILKEDEVLKLLNRIDRMTKTEENMKKDISSEISTMAKGLVEEELKDVTDNLKKIVDFARKHQVKQEDVEHIVENRISSLTADYNKFGKALGTLQRVVQQEHVNISQNVHSKLDNEMSTVKDEIEDLREDIELLKNLRGDLVEDINKIIVGYENKHKSKAVVNLERVGEFEAERIDRLEEAFNKKLAEHIKQMEQMEPKHTGSQGVPAHIETKLSIIERENQSLREELEELKGAYFQIMNLQQNAPIIIE